MCAVLMLGVASVFLLPKLTERLVLRVSASDRVVDGDPDHAPDIRLERWVTTAQKHPAAAEVLALRGRSRQHDWATLYKIKERIEAGASPIPSDWASRKQLKRFDHTANSPDVLGEAANMVFRRTTLRPNR